MKINLKKSPSRNNLVLLDTCFLIDISDRVDYLKKLCSKRIVAMTSFNVEELEHVFHKLHQHQKENIRRIIKTVKIYALEIHVHPGNRKSEREFVQSTDPFLLKDIKDPSDAVLMATAIQTNSTVLTKDKHHLFTEILENYISRYSLVVLKSIHEL